MYEIQLTKTKVETDPWDLQAGDQSRAMGLGRLRSTAYDVAKVSLNGSPYRTGMKYGRQFILDLGQLKVRRPLSYDNIQTENSAI